MLATNTAFYVVFGIFVVAMVVLAVIIVIWAVRHDMTGWKAFRQRQEAAALAQQARPPVQDTPPIPPRTP
jgi:hypothetical protein